MKLDLNKILVILLGFAVTIAMAFVFYGCSANYHFTKFIQKGGKIDTNERIIEISKTIKVNGKDSLIILKVPSVCPEVKIPPTRFEKRIEYRLKRDTMRLIKFQTKWKVKEIVKTKRIERSDWWEFWLGLFAGLGGCVLTHFVIKKLGL
jgi:hypothetical protein